MSAKKIRRWKFLRSGLKSNFDGSQWVIGEWRKTECLELCHGFNCSRRITDAMNYVQGEILAEVEVEGRHFDGNDKTTHEQMRIIHAWHWKKADSVALSIFAAEMVLGNFEKVYPDDDRPRKAIEAARNYLDSPAEKNRSAARSAAWAAWSVESAWAAARSARSAESAARSAAWAAWSVESAWAAESAESAAESAAWSAVRSAAWSAWSAALDEIETWILNHIEQMEEWK